MGSRPAEGTKESVAKKFIISQGWITTEAVLDEEKQQLIMEELNSKCGTHYMMNGNFASTDFRNLMRNTLEFKSEVVELDAEHSTIHFHVQPEKQSWLHVDETEPPEVPDMGGVRPDGAACCARKCSKCPKLGGQRRLLPAPEPR